MRPMLQIAVFVGLALCLGCGVSNGTIDRPAKAGTAEQLANTTWSTSGGTLTFLPGSALQFVPKASSSSPMPAPKEPLTGNYSVADGIVRASVANTMPFAGTWDGEILTIGDETCTRVSTP